MACRRILLTPGEPAGIGPELAVRAAQEARDYELCAIASPALLQQTAARLKLPLSLRVIEATHAPKATFAGELACIAVNLNAPVEAGKLNPANASYVIETLKTANTLCLDKTADAVVTGPVQKSIINDAGIPFSGHTEYFAEHSDTKKVVMMLATEGLRVALVTTHLPLKDVSAAITKNELRQTIQILHDELIEKFGLASPRILVCGLNPHAGEGGHLGFEEIDTIIPVLEEFKAQGLNLVGPLPADTLFTPHHLKNADAVLAMYHDQGLPVLKYCGFGNAVNITLGLPYVRSSVDHGTALDLAGKGKANMGSMQVALQQADLLTKNRQAAC